MTFDPVSVHAAFAEREAIRYPLLADQGSAIIRAFGVLDENYPPGSHFHGVARHAIFVVDEKGVISHRFVSRGYDDAPSVEDVLAVLGPKAGG